jgi:hypothetical protein
VNRENYKITFLLTLLIFFGLSGCIPITTKPDFANPELNIQEINQLYIMPVLDFRIDKEDTLSLDELMHDWAVPVFKIKGYKCTVIKNRSMVAGIQKDHLLKPDSLWLSNLGPIEARWLFFFTLDDFSAQLTFGSMTNAEMSAYIFDKLTNKLLWKNKEIEQHGALGLIHMASHQGNKKLVIARAMRRILYGLPVKTDSLSGDVVVIAGDELSATEVTKLFSGKTVDGINVKKENLKPYKAYFNPDGTIQAKHWYGKKHLKWRKRNGKWWIDNKGHICVKWEDKDKKKCMVIEKEGEIYRQYRIKKDGSRKHVATFEKFTDGNPDDL